MKTIGVGLRKGFSTGSVSAAAIKASLRYFFKRQEFLDIKIKMPDNEYVSLDVARLSSVFPYRSSFTKGNAGECRFSAATVIKDSGDDPDITNGIKICADFMAIDDSNNIVDMLSDESESADIGMNDNGDKNDDAVLCLYEKISSAIMNRLPKEMKNYYKKLYIYNIIRHSGFMLVLASSVGIGIAGRRGLPIKPGFPAVNPIPLKMIEWAVREEIDSSANDSHGSVWLSVLYVPNGAVVAEKTLNPRLGIKGGISILGTTGYVIPISTKAWLETIKVSLSFLSENGINECIYTPGRFSEKIATKLFRDMPKESFIEIGDYVSYSMRKAVQYDVKKIIFVGQFGKIVKILQGARNTNAKYGSLDLRYLSASVRATLRECTDISDGTVDDLCNKIDNSNTSRQAYGYILPLSTFYQWLPDRILYDVLKTVKKNLIRMAGKSIDIDIVLISYEGKSLVSTLNRP